MSETLTIKAVVGVCKHQNLSKNLKNQNEKKISTKAGKTFATNMTHIC